MQGPKLVGTNVSLAWMLQLN